MKLVQRLSCAALCLILCLFLLPLSVSSEDGAAAGNRYDIPDTVEWITGSDKIFQLPDGLAVSADFSCEIPDRGVAMLVFFNTAGDGSREEISAIAGVDWLADPRLNILALETDIAPRARVQSFMDELAGASQEYFHTLYGLGCQTILRKYSSLITASGLPACPFVILISSRCGVPTVRYAAEGVRPVSEIEAVLEELYTEAEETAGWTVAWEWSEDDESARAVFTSDAGDRQTEDAAVLRHTRPETCEEAGKTVVEAAVTFAGRTYRNRKETLIPARGHTETDAVQENLVPGTCLTEGLFDEVVRCGTCGKELSRKTVHTGYGDHSPGDPVRENIVAATYSSEGSYDTVTYCTVCKKELSRESFVVPMLTLRFDAAKGPGANFCAPVYRALGNSITAGTAENPFSPVMPCTRAQIVTLLWRAAGSPDPGSAESLFTDVKGSDRFFKAALWAVENGITTGTSPAAFSPNASCTRAQVLTFLWRAAGSPEPGGADNPFTDVKESDWFFKPVLWAVENGIAGRSPGSAFTPNSPCTRGQAMAFLRRANSSPAA